MKYLFLDLENTVIDSWDNLIILNNPEVHKNIKSISPDKVGIFSFAIWNEADKDKFFLSLMNSLNQLYNIQIDPNLVYSLEEVKQAVAGNIKLSNNDFIKCFGKDLAFIKFSRDKFIGHDLYLIDDLVEFTNIETDSIKITLLNPILKRATKESIWAPR